MYQQIAASCSNFHQPKRFFVGLSVDLVWRSKTTLCKARAAVHLGYIVLAISHCLQITISAWVCVWIFGLHNCMNASLLNEQHFHMTWRIYSWCFQWFRLLLCLYWLITLTLLQTHITFIVWNDVNASLFHFIRCVIFFCCFTEKRRKKNNKFHLDFPH